MIGKETNRHGITKTLVMIYQQDSLSAWNNFWGKQTLTTSSFNKINIDSYRFLYLHSWFDKTGCTVVINPPVSCIGFRGWARVITLQWAKSVILRLLRQSSIVLISHWKSVFISSPCTRFASHNKWHKLWGLYQQNFIGLQQGNVASNVRVRRRQREKTSLIELFF